MDSSDCDSGNFAAALKATVVRKTHTATIGKKARIVKTCHKSGGNLNFQAEKMMTRPNDATRKLNDQQVLAAQLYIQNNLGNDLSLDSIARTVGSSPSHLHRLFKARVGETIKKHCDRLRVEKSLYDIRLTDSNLLQISLRYGFRNPETYSRVFKRYLGKPPSHFLATRNLAPASKPAGRGGRLAGAGLRSSKESGFSITRLNDIHLAFIRHIGPYEQVPLISDQGKTLWNSLRDFASNRLGLSRPFIYIGIPQDSPNTTAPRKQRFDLCVLMAKPFRPRGEIGYQRIHGGFYGVLTHAGPYATLAQTYIDLFTNASRSKRFAIDPEGQVFELLIDISATTIEDHTWTELYIPLRIKGVIE